MTPGIIVIVCLLALLTIFWCALLINPRKERSKNVVEVKRARYELAVEERKKGKWKVYFYKIVGEEKSRLAWSCEPYPDKKVAEKCKKAVLSAVKRNPMYIKKGILYARNHRALITLASSEVEDIMRRELN